MILRDVWHIPRETLKGFMADKAMELGAAVAFYALLSLAPLLLLVVTIAGMVYGGQQVSDEVVKQMQTMIGPQGAEVAKTILSNAGRQEHSGLALLVSIVGLVLGATGVFVQLQSALNQLWNVEKKPGLGVWGVIGDRLRSLGLIVLIGILLLALVVADAVLSTVMSRMSDVLPVTGTFLYGINVLVSVITLTVLFAAIFKILPDVDIQWRDVWVGAAVTGIFFTVGKMLLGLYLGYSAVGSAYGAAGSLIAVVVWVYYSALIFLLGAEFTQVYARHTGTQIQPSQYAVPTHSGRLAET